VLFVILSVSEGSDVAFEGIKPGSFGQKNALRMTSSGVVLNVVKDLFLVLRVKTGSFGQKPPSG